MKKILLFFVIIMTFPSLLFSEKIILEQIEKVNKYQIREFYFNTAVITSPLKNFIEKDIVIKADLNVKDAILTIFDINTKKLYGVSNFEKFKIKNDSIIFQKYLILDTNYQIVNINNARYYKFKLYVPLKHNKNIFHKIWEQYNIEYGRGNIK